MKTFKQFLFEALVKLNFSDKETEEKIRAEVRKRIRENKLRDNAEMAEHYQDILNTIFDTESICDVSDDEFRMFMAIVDNEYENAGLNSDLTNVKQHIKGVKTQLKKLKEIQK